MNRIVKTFEKAFETAKRKNWDKIYVAVDLHETCLKPTWQKEISTEYYSFAKDVLLILSERPDICLILWSCSLAEINKEYYDFFKQVLTLIISTKIPNVRQLNMLTLILNCIFQ